MLYMYYQRIHMARKVSIVNPPSSFHYNFPLAVLYWIKGSIGKYKICHRAQLHENRTRNLSHATVNVDIFVQYIFSHISRRALDVRKYDVSEKMNHYRSNRNTYWMHETLSTLKCHVGLDARKFSFTKISAFTVYAQWPAYTKV